MSDILLARREARKRKILENSENRLKRITGKSEVEENSGKIHIEENGFVNVADEVISNGAIKYERENNLYLSSSPLMKKGTFSDNTKNYRHFDSSSAPEYAENDELSSLHIIPSYQVDRHFIYISMAMLFRLLIEFNIHYICANSMVVAFLLIKCGVLGIYGLQIPETSRYLGSLLLLSGISPQKIRLFTLYIGTLYSASRDFAIYTFVFVFSDMFVTTFKYIFM